MSPVIGLIAQGAMGAGIGRRLVDKGLQVKTVLDGRSAASTERAAKAGMSAASWDDMAQVDIFLSVLPPGEAQALANKLAPILKASAKKPVYADLNAVEPCAPSRKSRRRLRLQAACLPMAVFSGSRPAPTTKARRSSSAAKGLPGSAN